MKSIAGLRNCFWLAAACAAMVAAGTNAAVTPEEAAQLKTTLTPLGAERAGNKDGTIPAWTGGCPDLKAPIDKLKAGDRTWDPFAQEKPLFTVTAENAAQYGDKVTPGMLALLKKFPTTLRLNVYKTHRTACAPDWVYENTFKNATRAKLVEAGGDSGVEGAVGGIAFPIPKSGLEVRWNLNYRWRGGSWEALTRHVSWTADGQKVLGNSGPQYDQYEIYRPGQTLEQWEKGGYLSRLVMGIAEGPPFRVGEASVVRDTGNYLKAPYRAWSYLVGQRRVRVSPDVGWDTPSFQNSGVNFLDETFGQLILPQERHDYKIVGKREIFIPYNNNRIFGLKEDEIFGPKHFNPDAFRWELHRVWVIEATLKPGRRHAVPRRTFYIDEDTWGTALVDGYDAGGKLWRVGILPSYYFPDMPGVFNAYSQQLYLINGGYAQSSGSFYQVGGHMKPVPFKPLPQFSPEVLLDSAR